MGSQQNVRLRQVALVAETLAPVRAQLMALLGLSKDYQDPGVGEFGLENSVMSIGDTFLEVVAPTQPSTAAGRLLQTRGGNGGYMLLLQVDDIDLYRQHTEQLQMRKIWSRDSVNVKAFHLHPKDMGATIVSLDWMQPASAWEWGGPDWQTQAAANATIISAVDIQADDPAALAAHWATILQRPAQQVAGQWQIVLDQGQINFTAITDGRGPGVAGLTFAVPDLAPVQAQAKLLGLNWQNDQLQVCGTWLRFSSGL
jgi:hypothetical protein